MSENIRNDLMEIAAQYGIVIDEMLLDALELYVKRQVYEGRQDVYDAIIAHMDERSKL